MTWKERRVHRPLYNKSQECPFLKGKNFILLIFVSSELNTGQIITCWKNKSLKGPSSLQVMIVANRYILPPSYWTAQESINKNAKIATALTHLKEPSRNFSYTKEHEPLNVNSKNQVGRIEKKFPLHPLRVSTFVSTKKFTTTFLFRGTAFSGQLQSRTSPLTKISKVSGAKMSTVISSQAGITIYYKTKLVKTVWHWHKTQQINP